MRATALLVLFSCTGSGCVLTLSDPPDPCSCSAGQACVDDRCVAVAGDQDAGAPPADAQPAPGEEPAADAAAPVALQSCDEQFGAATEYVLCGEDDTSCTFFARTAGGTCADQCALAGSECVGGYDSNAEAPCTVVTEDGCLASHSTQTCTCSRAAAAVGGL